MKKGLKITAFALITSVFLSGCASFCSKSPQDPAGRPECERLNCRQLQAKLELLKKQKQEWTMAREPERLHLARLEALTGQEDDFGLSELAKIRLKEKLVLDSMEAKGCR